MSDNRFVWFDLFSTDAERARAFYTAVLPWTVQSYDMGDYGEYPMFSIGERGIGGSGDLPAEAEAMGAPSHWLAYVTVEDVDATAKKAAELGGKVLKEASDIPGVGRFAVIADPQGGILAPFRGEGDGMPDVEPGVGDFSWHELQTPDQEGGLAFYTALFSWTLGESFPGLGADSPPYQFLCSGDRPFGGAVTLPAEVSAGRPASWLHYVTVADIDETVTAVKANEGQLLHGPVEVPGGGRIAVFMDPTGAAFAAFASPA